MPAYERARLVSLIACVSVAAVVFPAVARAGALTGTLTRGTGTNLNYQVTDSGEALNHFQLKFADTLQFSTHLTAATCPAGWTLTTAFNSGSFGCDGGTTANITAGQSVTGTATTATCVPAGFVVQGMATDTQSMGVPPQENFTLMAAPGDCLGATQISGTVTDAVGDPSSPEGGVVVRATRSTGQQVTAKTDATGNYKLSVSPGTYTVAPEGINPRPASKQVSLTTSVSGVDFSDEPIGLVTLGAGELSFGVASAQIGITSRIGGSAATPGFVVSKPLDRVSPAILKDAGTGRRFPIAFLDLYQPGTTTIASTAELTDATIESATAVPGEPPGEIITVAARSQKLLAIPACQPSSASLDAVQADQALVCPLTEAQKAAALAAYQKYSVAAADMKEAQNALGCFPHPDREVRLACAAVALTRLYDDQQAQAAQKILDDPPDRHFTKVAKPRSVHPKKISSPRFKAFNTMIADLAQIGALEGALVISANRESGALRAKSTSGVKLQRSAIKRYAGQIIALVHRIAKLEKAASKPFAGLHAKRNPKQPIVIDIGNVIAGNVALAAALQPSAH